MVSFSEKIRLAPQFTPHDSLSSQRGGPFPVHSTLPQAVQETKGLHRQFPHSDPPPGARQRWFISLCMCRDTALTRREVRTNRPAAVPFSWASQEQLPLLPPALPHLSASAAWEHQVGAPSGGIYSLEHVSWGGRTAAEASSSHHC